VWFGCATAKATLMTLYPRILPILLSGTASAGASGTITLAAGAYDLTGCIVRTTGGTGGGGTGGANNQARVITAYNTSTKVATVVPNWETTPDNTTTYDILLTDLAVNSPVTRGLRPTTDGNTLDVTSTGGAGVDWSNVEAPTTSLNLSGTTVKTATDVEAKLPAALVGGRMDASVGAMASGVVTATAIATDAIDADALAADAVTELQSGLSTLTAAGVRTAVGLASANLDTQLAALPTATQNADALLKRDWTAVTGAAARSVLNALRFLRNKWYPSGSDVIVTEEDDTTEAWRTTVTTSSSADPITSSDPTT
jgi:hypothetical protein